MELILHYFPQLTDVQRKQLAALESVYHAWNEKINVISRKDIQHLYEHHVLHSLSLAKYNPFTSGMKVLDAGTGGGFPGVPLAILYPDVQFTLLDATAKKIHVATKVIEAIGLENATGIHSRLEEHHGEYDIMTSRAVSSLPQMVEWSKSIPSIRRWLVLKGGNPKEIRKELPPLFQVKSIPVSDYFKEEYFIEKFVVDVKM